MINNLEKKYYQVREIIYMYESVDDSDIKKILQHHLLITVYTSYEEAIKAIIQKQYQDASQNFKIQPLLIGSKINSQKWTPNVKKENMIQLFPILKEWMAFDKFTTSIDSMIAARHKYAHTGSYTITFENILFAYISSLHTIFFLYEIYIYQEGVSIEPVKEVFSQQKIMFGKAEKDLKTCNDLKNSDKTSVPKELKERFDQNIQKLTELSLKIEMISLRKHILCKPDIKSLHNSIGDYQKCFCNFLNVVKEPNNPAFNHLLSNSVPDMNIEIEKLENYFDINKG